MDCEGGLVQIALELKAGLLDELLVLGIMGNGGKLANGLQSSQPFQIYVEKAICPRQKSSGLRRCTPA